MSVEFFPIHYTHEDICQHALKEIIINQHKILKNQGVIMSALSDFKDAITELSTEVDAFIAANTGGASDADLVAATADLKAISAKLAPPATPAV